MKYVPDRTGRFTNRPHFRPEELDRECEKAITDFLIQLYGTAKFPVSTEDLTKLIERDTDDLDLFADLSRFGPTVEGLTEFRAGNRPRVKISNSLAEDARRENRLRTTLTHEWGHVRYHAHLWELEPPSAELLSRNPDASRQICGQETILDARQTDWMEWQAGYVCGAVLMPATRVRSLASKQFESEGIVGVVPADSHHAQNLISEMKAAFHVSAAAARVRLLKLSILGPDQGLTLFDLSPAA